MPTHSDYDLLIKGYNQSQCFLLRIGAMYVLGNKQEPLNWVYVILFHLIYYLFLFWIIPYDLMHTIPMGHMTATFQGMHYYCTMLGYTIASYFYHFNRKSIDYSLIVIGKGFFSYEEEDNSTRTLKEEDMKKKKQYLKKLTYRVMVVVFITAGAVIVLPTITELITRTESVPDGELVNPYLPIPLVAPWDPYSVPGFLVMYILLIMVTYNICTELLALSMGYTSFMIIYINQFNILNKSISAIEERATKMYIKITGLRLKGIDKFKDPLFQECMNFCLKQNIKHHLVLLKWIKEASNFLGWALLCTFFTTSFLLAASGFLITAENSSILKSIILVQVQVLELLHAYLFCWWGENLSTESGKLPNMLYNTPWYCCGKRYNRLIHIMICNSSKAVVPKDPVFKIQASLEVYKSILSTGYSYFNLLRSMN